MLHLAADDAVNQLRVTVGQTLHEICPVYVDYPVAAFEIRRVKVYRLDVFKRLKRRMTRYRFAGIEFYLEIDYISVFGAAPGDAVIAPELMYEDFAHFYVLDCAAPRTVYELHGNARDDKHYDERHNIREYLRRNRALRDLAAVVEKYQSDYRKTGDADEQTFHDLHRYIPLYIIRYTMLYSSGGG